MNAQELITEKELQSTVIGWAETYGWLVYHQVDMGFKDPMTGKWKHSRRIGPGFPDLVLVHPKRGRLIFAELKAEKGKVKSHQQEWGYHRYREFYWSRLAPSTLHGSDHFPTVCR